MLDELDRVRAHGADQPDPDQVSYNSARAALAQAIEGEPRTPRRRPSLARRQRLRRTVLGGGIAGVAIVIAGMIGFQTAATPASALAQEMSHLASIAAGQPAGGIPGPGQFLYTQSQSLTDADTMGNGQECAVTLVQHRQSWIATDGSGAINQSDTDGKFTSAADQAVCASQFKITNPASQDNSWNNSFPAGAAGLSFPTRNWGALSTDPATLLKQVHRLDGGPNDPSEWFANIADFMRESDAPAGIRSALYQAAALIPGVRLMGTQTDPTGGTGLGVGEYADGQLQDELIFSPQTAGLQAEEYFNAAGTLTNWSVYQPSQIVNSHPNYPIETPGPDTTSSSGSGAGFSSAPQPAGTTTTGSGTTTAATGTATTSS